jgi:hypothetical protein
MFRAVSTSDPETERPAEVYILIAMLRKDEIKISGPVTFSGGS